jgi:hypothetical protein
MNQEEKRQPTGMQFTETTRWGSKVVHTDDGDPRVWISMPLGQTILCAVILLAIGKWVL